MIKSKTCHEDIRVISRVVRERDTSGAPAAICPYPGAAGVK